MIETLRTGSQQRNTVVWLIVAAVFVLAFLTGQRASFTWLELLVAGLGAVVLLQRPILGLPMLLVAALFVPLDISTGTDVKLNPASLLVPVVTVLWLLDMTRHRTANVVNSPTTRPLLLFLLAGLLSLLVGRATWDPQVPVRDSFLLVQFAQWAIFVLSACAFWLTNALDKSNS